MEKLLILIALAMAIFYCTMSHSNDICTNQAMTAGDGCDVYVITD